MARKSKRAVSGHLPLTQHEQRQYSKEESYGTTSKRLGGESQYAFGTCALQLTPALVQPVATPAMGYIYERGAILEYLLTKTQDLKKLQREYDMQEEKLQKEREQAELDAQDAAVREFDQAQRRVAASSMKDGGSASFKRQKKSQGMSTALVVADPATAERAAQKPKAAALAKEANPLKRTSYWLAEFQPEVESAKRLEPPPKRPPSPNSAQPLRRKDLIPLQINRTADQNQHPLCALSEKRISTQPAIALVTKKTVEGKDELEYAPAHVVLKEAFEKCVKNDSKTSKKYCPISGRKIVKILTLQQGGSSFSSLDDAGRQGVEASTYRPSMT